MCVCACVPVKELIFVYVFICTYILGGIHMLIYVLVYMDKEACAHEATICALHKFISSLLNAFLFLNGIYFHMINPDEHLLSQ